MTHNFATGTDAIIYLKNGKRKYGLLLGNLRSIKSYQFIPNEKINHFISENDASCIECLSEEIIEAIELDLK